MWSSMNCSLREKNIVCSARPCIHTLDCFHANTQNDPNVRARESFSHDLPGFDAIKKNQWAMGAGALLDHLVVHMANI